MPPPEIRALRVYTRHIWDLTADRTRYWQRLEKLLVRHEALDYWRIWLRREAPCCIPGLAGRNLEDIPGSDGLLKIRKVKGTTACQETSGRANAYGRRTGGPARYG